MSVHRLKEKLNKYSKNSLFRNRFTITERNDNFVKINGRSCISFCNNDYLGLANHPELKKAFVDGVQLYGAGSTSSAMVSGYFKPQKQLEEKFSEFLGRDHSVLFNSGYMANLGVITSIASRKDVILLDKFCHSSLLDAVRLSNAKRYRFKHNNLEHFNYLLGFKKPNIVITEGIFSMEGDFSPLLEISRCIDRKNILFIVDDAHGIGVLGKNGGGSCEKWGLTQLEVPCLIIPLGKAFACLGAIVSGRTDILEGILQFSKSYRATTSLPPALCVAAIKSLEIVKKEDWRREKLNEIISFFMRQASIRGLKFISDSNTPVKCLIVKDNEKIIGVQKKMLEKGFLISCIRPPTVPEGTARIRISLNCLHTKEQIASLICNLCTLC